MLEIILEKYLSGEIRSGTARDLVRTLTKEKREAFLSVNPISDVYLRNEHETRQYLWKHVEPIARKRKSVSIYIRFTLKNNPIAAR
jgi:hypothetical protein